MSRSIRRAARAFALCAAALALQANVAFAQSVPYVVDEHYAAGEFTEDAFAAYLESPNAGSVGKKVLRVGNDVLVVALVKHPSGNQTNGRWNIGITRYNDNASQRLTWDAAAPPYAHYLDQYIVYPNSPTALISNVQDVRVLGNRIYVLVDEKYTSTSNLEVARLYVFDLDGRFIAGAIPFSANGVVVGDTPTLAGGLATYTDLVANKRYIMVAGTRFLGGGARGRPVFVRYELVDTGGLGAATPMVTLDSSACSSESYDCHVRAIEANAPYSPKFYVAMAQRFSTAANNWDIVVARIDANGAGDTSFDPPRTIHGISDGGDGGDWPVGLEVSTPPSQGAFRDEIYVVSESARNCQPGIGMLRLDHDGDRVLARLIGGDTSTGQACNGNSRRFDKPKAIVANATNTHTLDARLAVVGLTGISYVIGPPTNATLTVFDADLQTSGTLDVRYPVDETLPFGSQFPALHGVVSDGDGSFTAVGSLTYSTITSVPVGLRGKSMTATIRFEADYGIFADEFE